MKVELDDNTTYALWVAIICICLTCAGLGGCHMQETTKREAIKAGLVEVNDFSQSVHWGKP